MKGKKTLLILAVFVVSLSHILIAQDFKPTISHNFTIKVGVEFKHQLNFNFPATIINPVYQLLRGPDGMKVEAATGLITWTPQAKGEFSAEISVTANSVKVGYAVIKLKVVDFFGTITGTVGSDDGKILAGASVTVFKKIVVAGKPDSFSAILKVQSDASGVYRATGLDGGTYILYAVANPSTTEPGVQYNSAYYLDSQTKDNATQIVITNETPVTANFNLHKIVKINVATVTFSANLIVNQQFSYQIDSKLTTGLTNITYMVKAGPTGLVVNAQGLVTWTPQSKGEFTAEIHVLSNNVKVAVVLLKFRVVDFYGTVSGTVTSDDAAPVPIQNVLVTLIKKISVTGKPDSFVSYYSALTSADGTYKIEKVEGGTYFVYAKPSNEKVVTSNPNAVIYLPMYYIDATTIDKADPVTIANATPVTANFKLHKYVKAEPVKANISGTVTDASNNPLANVRIAASATSKIISGNINSMDPASALLMQGSIVGTYADVTGDIKTDANGKYTISLIKGGTYIVAAHGVGYLVQYYNRKSNILEADKILLDNDKTGIDFKLNPAPAAKAVLSGKVTDANKLPVHSKVILYPAKLTITVIARTVTTNEKGEFVIEKVPNGEYILQAIPLKNYLPGYYKTNDCGVNEFKNATIITVVNDINVSGLDICVKKIVTNGSGNISGKIENNSGLGIAGAIVIAESNNECSFAITETDGSYIIENLSSGNYMITSDKPGYISNPGNTAAIDYEQNIFSSSVNVIMNNNSVTDADDDKLPSKFSLEQNYPNPFNPTTSISYQLTAFSHVMLKVYDLLGREVATLVDEMKQPGRYEVKFNGSNISSGTYFYRLQAGDFISTKKLVLMK